MTCEKAKHWCPCFKRGERGETDDEEHSKSLRLPRDHLTNGGPVPLFFEEFDEACWSATEDWERSPVHGHDDFDVREHFFEGESTTLRTHRKMIADASEDCVNVVKVTDDPHVGEHVRVPGVIDVTSVWRVDHPARCLARLLSQNPLSTKPKWCWGLWLMMICFLSTLDPKEQNENGNQGESHSTKDDPTVDFGPARKSPHDRL